MIVMDTNQNSYIAYMKNAADSPKFHTNNAPNTTQKKVRFLESLQLPRDVCLGGLRVTLTGSTEAWVENYRGLLEYSEQSILLQGKTCQVCFEGTELSIDYYTNEDMKITGCITNVRYL
jgi:sporulation protein YqfC